MSQWLCLRLQQELFAAVAMALDPGLPSAYRWRYMARRQRGDAAGALADLRACVRLTADTTQRAVGLQVSVLGLVDCDDDVSHRAHRSFLRSAACWC